MQVVVERCAFLDVHRDTVMACARAPDGAGGRREEVSEFRTTTSQLLLSDWLVERGVTLVGMEATGVYSKPVHWVLEDVIEAVWVINARHICKVPGRKTDVADACWGAQLLEHGLVRPSFIPPRPAREQRDLTRYRKSVIEERGRETQRLHKVLEDAGVKLSSVASSVLTKSGREMIDALIAAQPDPAVLAELAKGRVCAKIPELKDALAGRFNAHHALLCRAMLARIDQADATIAELTARIETLLDPHEAAVTLLVGIPGVSYRIAQVILAGHHTPGSVRAHAGILRPGAIEASAAAGGRGRRWRPVAGPRAARRTERRCAEPCVLVAGHRYGRRPRRRHTIGRLGPRRRARHPAGAAPYRLDGTARRQRRAVHPVGSRCWSASAPSSPEPGRRAAHWPPACPAGTWTGRD